MTRIVHLSDTHIDGSRHAHQRLARILERAGEIPKVDIVVISGDLTDRGDTPSTDEFFALVADVHQPLLVIPGNHDLRAPLAVHLDHPSGYVNTTLTAAGVTIVGIDSLVEHHDEGALSPETLAYARAAVAAAPGPVVLTVHHPPVTVGNTVMDGIRLHEAAGLAEVVADDRVLAVLTGHLHTPLATTFAGKPVLTAPGVVSTFRLEQADSVQQDRSAAPGLAVHDVQADGRIVTAYRFAEAG